jgi:hypothetical protein
VTALAYRSARPADLHFIEETFLDSFRLAHSAGLIAIEEWKEIMSRQWRRLISRPGVEMVVAYHPGDVEPRADLYGWIAVERSGTYPFLLYVYVKQPYRRMRIGRGLLLSVGLGPEVEFEYAAKTPVVTRLTYKFPRATWNPLRARFPPRD